MAIDGIRVPPGTYCVLGVGSIDTETLEVPVPSYGAPLQIGDDGVRPVQMYDAEDGQPTALYLDVPGEVEYITLETCAECAAVRPRMDLRRCSKCRRVRYCNRTCQRRHWEVHQGGCA